MMASNPCVGVELQLGGATYTYWTHIPDLKKGDHVVVELPPRTKRLTHFIVGVVRDTNPSKKQCELATKWIVCKVDVDAYQALTQMTPMGDDDV